MRVMRDQSDPLMRYGDIYSKFVICNDTRSMRITLYRLLLLQWTRSVRIQMLGTTSRGVILNY